jgi:hypothetical protein
MAPGLVVNGKLVYFELGRIPKKNQVIGPAALTRQFVEEVNNSDNARGDGA